MVGICPFCQRERKEITLAVNGRTLLVPVACPCELRHYEKEKRKSEYHHRTLQLESYFPPPELSRYRKPFTLHPGVERAYTLVSSYIESLRENLSSGRGLLFFGPPGVGKTHLAASVFFAAQEDFHTGLFISAPSLMVHFDRALDEEGLSEWELLELILSPELFILDDLGAERQSSRSRERLYSVLSGRYTERRSTIITTNFPDPPGLLHHLGERLFDRLVEVTTFVKCSGSSFRQGKEGSCV